MHIWLSLIGPKLEVGAKIREAVSYESSPGHLEGVVSSLIVNQRSWSDFLEVSLIDSRLASWAGDYRSWVGFLGCLLHTVG